MEEIDLKRFIKTVSNLKLIIISIIILAIACGCYYSYCMVVPKYKSSVTVLLTQVEEKKDEITQSDVSLNNNLLTTYTQLIKSKSVLKPVIENLGLDMTEDELEKNITVSTTSNSQTLDIIAYNEEAKNAQDIADEISDVFAAKVKEIYKINNVTIIDEAFLPENPYNVNHVKDVRQLKIVGAMNDADWDIIDMMANNLFSLDLSEAKITKIKDRQFQAYEDWIYLHEIKLPEGLESIGERAFNKSNIAEIKLPSTLLSIGYGAFEESKIKSVNIPDAVKEIGTYAFYDCDSLTSITIPDSVISIGDYAFDDCDSLTIQCNPGSYAIEYCYEYNLEYFVTPDWF